MKRLLAFIRRLLPKCGAPIFRNSTDPYHHFWGDAAHLVWSDPRCTRLRWHKGPHFWLYTEKPSFAPLPIARAQRPALLGQSGQQSPRLMPRIIWAGTKILGSFWYAEGLQGMRVAALVVKNLYPISSPS